MPMPMSITTRPKRKIPPSRRLLLMPSETLASIPSLIQPVVIIVCVSGSTCIVAAIVGGVVEWGVVGHIDRESGVEIEIGNLIWSAC